MAICVGYFTPEGMDTPGTFSVSGYVSSKARWRQFDTQWTRALRQEDLLTFNAGDFARGVGAFASGWSDQARRSRLIERLSRIIDQHAACAFSCSVRLDEYVAVDAEHGLRKVAGP